MLLEIILLMAISRERKNDNSLNLSLLQSAVYRELGERVLGLITWHSRASGCKSCGIVPALSPCHYPTYHCHSHSSSPSAHCNFGYHEIQTFVQTPKWLQIIFVFDCVCYQALQTSTGDIISPFISTATCWGSTDSSSLVIMVIIHQTSNIAT